jgi:hypothetical protein
VKSKERKRREEQRDLEREQLIGSQSAGKERLDYEHSKVDTPCGGGLEYLHRSPTSRKRRQKGNPVPGGITGPPCSWGSQLRQ